jgi:hypothetical protein
MKARKYDEIFAPNVVLDQCFVTDQDKSTVVSGTIIDSVAMMDVIQGPQGSGQRVQLLGVTGDQVSAEIADFVQIWSQSYICGWNTARSHFWWGIDDTYRSSSYSCYL